MPGRGTGPNKRFCHRLCVEAYDAGYVHRDGGLYGNHREPGNFYSLPVRGDGFLIECKGSRKPFVSKGLRCCGPDCERRYRERQEIAATMAEVGAELVGDKRCCEQCGKALPRWLPGGRGAVPVTRRFCSEKCQKRARRLSRSTPADLSA
jgi:hypothetical protein